MNLKNSKKSKKTQPHSRKAAIPRFKSGQRLRDETTDYPNEKGKDITAAAWLLLTAVGFLFSVALAKFTVKRMSKK